jgi:hypothetical protein
MSARGQSVARIWDMWCAGARALRGRWRLAAGLYAVQLGITLVFLLAAARTMTLMYGDLPIFDRAVAGDVVALVGMVQHRPGVLTGIMATGMAMVVGYAVLSWYLSAGTLGALAGDSFTEAAGARFFAFFRVWLWSLIPYAVSLIAIGMGVGVVAAARNPIGALTWFEFVGRPLLAALPGLILLGVTTSVTNYAQAILATERKRGATRAWFRAWRLVFTRPWPLVHYFVYAILWALITALYVQGTVGSPFAGAGSALGLFAIRQVIAMTRFTLRFATTAGQLAGVSGP